MNPTERTCSTCNVEMPAKANFCMKCGAKGAVSPAQAPSDSLRDALVVALGSRYEVMRLLGRGGMGAVYLARETALDRLVAVKVLPPEASDDQSRERFQREARTAAKLTHPNIVPLYSFGESGSMMYFVMGFVQGESLAERMARLGKIPEKEARRVLAEIADALHYAHAQHLVHRDIKPDNILIDDATGKPLLTDFGIAKAQASGSTLTAIGAIVGTPHYMSPEQASGDRDLDGRSDLYSLGVVAYRMLAGELPFDGSNLQEVIVQHVTKEAPNLADITHETSETVARTIARCLAKDPDERWQDAGAFRSAIREEGTSEANLPLSLRLGEGLVPKAMLTLSVVLPAWLVLTLNESIFVGTASVLTIGTIMGSLGTWLRMLRRRKEKGYTVAEMKTLALRPPGWWPFAWPRRLRRPEDIWERLAPEVKKARKILGWTGLLLTVNFYLFLLMMSLDEPQRVLADIFFWVAAITGVAGFTLLTVRARLWARRLGVEGDVMSRAVHTPTCKLELWRSPELSRLLLSEPPQDERRKLAEPRLVQDFVEAIRLAGNEMHGANRAMGEEALSAARQLVSSIEKAEREIKRASHEVDEGEVSKLEARLEALGEAASASGDFDEDMRRLIENQLLLHRRLAERLTAAKERHDRMSELLKLLWLNVSDLRTQQSEEVHDASEITGKIRTLCEDIERHVAATEETVKVLT